MDWFILKHIFSTIFTFLTIGRLSRLEKDLEILPERKDTGTVLCYANSCQSCSANSTPPSNPIVLRKWVHDILFRPIDIFVMLEMKKRQIAHAAVTSSPTDAWAVQQLREATPWCRSPKYLIRDPDGKYGEQFTSLAASNGIKELKTPYRAQNANPFSERGNGEYEARVPGSYAGIAREAMWTDRQGICELR